MIFNDKIDCVNFCNNCIYNYKEAREVQVFKIYNIIAKLNIIYINITKHINYLFFDKY